jgi:hypothetical protein
LQRFCRDFTESLQIKFLKDATSSWKSATVKISDRENDNEVQDAFKAFIRSLNPTMQDFDLTMDNIGPRLYEDNAPETIVFAFWPTMTHDVVKSKMCEDKKYYDEWATKTAPWNRAFLAGR